ncbi:SGNH/GDSL hydrolase family protein [Marinobacter sp.]|uniref:SGNH/GDSL hydrolase family protein n=1 Tax=Marinobacter sp. TaxID=50741 RepID=UPI0035652388
MSRSIAYGDCNTEGLKTEHFPLWPEIVSESMQLELTNCGHTMSTTRELLQYNRSFPAAQYDVAFIQYGLVDSWLTFRGAPYVLYYPDYPLRKLARKLVKKMKKFARTWQLQKRFGVVEQVPPTEYMNNLHAVITSAPDTQFVLVATAPNLDESRNGRIKSYNQILARIAYEHERVLYVDTYEDIWAHRHQALMSDGTHLTAAGHELVADAVKRALQASAS